MASPKWQNTFYTARREKNMATSGDMQARLHVCSIKSMPLPTNDSDEDYMNRTNSRPSQDRNN